MNMTHRQGERGAVTGAAIAAIILGILAAAFAGLGIWAYLNYAEQKTDVDGRVATAVAEAKKEQSDQDEKKFADREKEPNRQFVGPDDYGRVTFDYPKTWSSYVAKDVSNGGNYEAYLNPITVPFPTTTQQFGLRVLIEEKDYDTVVSSYQSLVKKGDLRSSITSANGENGTRIDGSFSKDIRGAAVIYKIRDKTLTLRTDADTFKPDFENIIKTIKFNQ